MTREIATVSLSVAQDPGHGGPHSHYSIRRGPESYEVSVNISQFFPSTAERSFQPSVMTRRLHKDDTEVIDFFSRLAVEYRVFELEDRACPHAFLHPAFYKFRFTDGEEISHDFEYSVEAGRHHDETYRDLIAEFERFFEAKRIAREFYER